jgi:glycosyltransferase involved in cell wall biosynthesis
MRMSKSDLSVSVCMATYNGGQYLQIQLQSILTQLGPTDELIVADDGSSDHTLELLHSLADERIRVLPCSGIRLGPVRNFERAISSAGMDIIVLSDQDDIWHPDKLKTIRTEFNEKTIVAMVSDARIIDASGAVIGESFQATKGSAGGFWSNLLRNRYLGCCMAFRREANAFLLPFPRSINMHDEWIGLCCSLAGRLCWVPHKLIDYRRHDGNVTSMSHGSLTFMVKKRLVFLLVIACRLMRIHSWRRRFQARSRMVFE